MHARENCQSQLRTQKSIKNSLFAMGFYIANLILQFFSRKVFLEYLGTEILGLNTTAMNLLQFLNLAELGINSAVGFTLYKPLFDKDRDTINDIITLQGRLYQRIGILILFGALGLMAFFPLIYEKIELPLWYAYASFSVLLFSSLLGYFINYKQILLTANQEDYKITGSYKVVMMSRLVFQIFAVSYFEHGYVWWLVIEALFSLFASLTLNKVISKTFPSLQKSKKNIKELASQYSTLTTKIKQLFFHKIGGFILGQSATIIMYAYGSLTLVALYGNYYMIISGVQILFTSIFNSISAGIGNLVAENNRSRIIDVFFELFSFRFWLVSTVCMCCYVIIPPFVSLWIGPEYLMENTTLILMIATMFIGLIRFSVDAYVFAYGLFQDVWAPLFEASINIGLSILLGYYFGLNGILTGVLISQISIILLWKPYFFFMHEFPHDFGKYWGNFFIHLFAAALVGGIVLKILQYIQIPYNRNFLFCALGAIACAVLYGLLLALLLCAMKRGLLKFADRIFNVVFKK